MSARAPIRCASSAVREFFTAFDESTLTHQELASKSGVSLLSINRWRSGRGTPKVMDFECLCQVLGYRVALVPK